MNRFLKENNGMEEAWIILFIKGLLDDFETSTSEYFSGPKEGSGVDRLLRE